jgi:hypothetical protein
MENGRMGSGPCWDLLENLKPKNWYAAHMHCRFDATVEHSESERTRFVALDKCLPKRRCLDFLDIGDDNTNPPVIQYDLEWLTVLHLTNNFLNVNQNYTKLPLRLEPDDPEDNMQRFDFRPTEEEMNAVLKRFNNDLTIPANFTQTRVAYDPQRDGRNFRNLNERIIVDLNPQTTDFCVKLGVDDPLFLVAKFAGIELTNSAINLNQTASEKVPKVVRAPLASFLPQPKFGNDEEIDLDELEEEDVVVEKVEVEGGEGESGGVGEGLEEIPEVPKATSEVPKATPEVPEPTPPPQQVPAPQQTSEDPDLPSPPKKMFKRRNAEIRADNDD